ncbi:hypothetical protein [Pseudomonas savastanoi]|uniref:hypothetical protein n=1 Tax=Pseudomonas savastanoi TaxID=29438 RepID=UPI0002E61C36|nr:hypothetical protein [Pseudomonas savastanoi]
MPTKKKSANATARELPSIPQELIEQSQAGTCRTKSIRKYDHPAHNISPYNVHFCSFPDSTISIFNRYVLARAILLSYYFRK